MIFTVPMPRLLNTVLACSVAVFLTACEDTAKNASNSPAPTTTTTTPTTTTPPPPAPTPTGTYSLTVTKSGDGTDSVNSAPSGIACGSDCNQTYNSGTQVTLTAAAGANRQFSGWSGACSGTSATCTVTMSATRNVTANFSAVQRTLSVSVSGVGSVTSNPTGINCGTSCSGRYDNGASVTLTAVPSAGQTFNGWSGACSGTGSCTVAMSSDRSVSAAFSNNAVASKFEGFGSSVTGGDGGTVVMVTNLSNSGAGSLREAVNGSNRIVRFAVAGTITLSSTLRVSGPNVTIDGFSAPSPGITITGTGGIEIGGNAYGGATSKGSNIVIQGLRFRNIGDDAIRIAFNAHDVVVDHNSFSGSADGEVDVTEGAYNVTLSYNIMSRNKGPGPSLLSYDSDRVSYHHNIYYQNTYRNPILTSTFTRAYSSGPQHTGLLADVRYNIVWGYTLGTYAISAGGSVATANIVSNLYYNFDGHPATAVIRDAYDTSTPRANAYIAGNVTIHEARGCAYTHSGGSCVNVTSANSENNHAEYSAPTITGPGSTDNQGRLNEWTKVHGQAGVVPFPDDSVDAEVRSAVSMPSLSTVSATWNR